MRSYTNKFYTGRYEKTRSSSEKILKIVCEYFKPNSVIDFGCATGVWLSEFKRKGIGSVLGIDGGWVDKNLLELAPEEFLEHDFSKEKLNVTKIYDIALCIEVAEHIPQEMDDMLIETLTESSDIILFSAAICGQGGTGHINERPQHYWARKFLDRDYVCVDLIRPNIWGDEGVNIVYQQNMLFYIKRDCFITLNLRDHLITSTYDMDRVHPELFIMRSSEKKLSPIDNIRYGLKCIVRGLFLK